MDNNLSEQAQQGNPEAIAALLSHGINTENITVKAGINKGFLEIILEADEVPDRYETVEIIRQELTELEPDKIERVKVAAKKQDKENYVWTQEFGLEVGAFSSLILPGSQAAARLQVPSVAETEIERENNPLDKEKLSRITLWFVVAVLAVAVIVFIAKMVRERWPSDEDNNPSAYARIIPNSINRNL
jgi:hypothetical protein